MRQLPALLVLENGAVFRGLGFGAKGSTVGEVVFNTAMSGYQEILTDPSYCRQIVALTAPHVGNVGLNSADAESATVQVAGLVIRDLPRVSNNWRAEESLAGYFKRHQRIGIADVDTRRLTRMLRTEGALAGCIVHDEEPSADLALAAARAFGGLKGMDLAQVVSAAEPYAFSQGSYDLDLQRFAEGEREFHVVAYDFGVKRNILRLLADLGCKVTVVPAQTPANTVRDLNPDGVFLSNGPGDPEPCTYAIDAAREFIAAGLPVFGICLGHQILGLALGAKTIKMKFGHHGANHPVIDLASGRVMISSQNHGFAVDEATLPGDVIATHRSLFDGSLQGLRHQRLPVSGFQGHPEASPGPHDVKPLFEPFIAQMRERKAA